MKNLFSQLMKLESTSLVIETSTLVTLWPTRAAATITSEVLSSFTSYENRDFIVTDLQDAYP